MTFHQHIRDVLDNKIRSSQRGATHHSPKAKNDTGRPWRTMADVYAKLAGLSVCQ
jgi:hypothetical protein